MRGMSCVTGIQLFHGLVAVIGWTSVLKSTLFWRRPCDRALSTVGSECCRRLQVLGVWHVYIHLGHAFRQGKADVCKPSCSRVRSVHHKIIMFQVRL